MVRSQTAEFGQRPRTPGEGRERRGRTSGAKSPLSMEITPADMTEAGLDEVIARAGGGVGATDATRLNVSLTPGGRPLSAVSAISDVSTGSREYDRLGLVPEVPAVARTDSSARLSHGRTGSGAGLVGVAGGAGDSRVRGFTNLVGSGTAEGKERYIQRLLEKKTAEAFPPPLTELGPKVTPPTPSPVVQQQRGRRSRPGGGGNGGGGGGGVESELRSWRPEGTLVAHLTEHRGSVNGLCVSPDHLFFATGSEDGTVRVWDTGRLEKNVTSRSRVIYDGHGGKVKALTFCENTHSIASAADNGSIHISRVEYMKTATSSRYAGYMTVKKEDLGDDYVQVIEHYEAEMQNILVYATARGRLCGLDLRTMKEAWSFDSPPHHGQITSLAIDPHRRAWITTGSTKGVMSLWDVRFGLRVKAWAHPSRGRIHKLAPYYGANRKSGRMVGVAIEGRTNEVSVWDVEEGVCKEIWCVIAGAGSGRSGVDVEEDMNKLYGEGLKAVAPPELSDYTNSGPAGNVKSAVGMDASVRSFVTSPDAPFLITGGSDRKIRFWDTSAVEASYVVSGLEQEEAAPRFSSHTFHDISFNLEYTPSHHFSSAPSTPTTPGPRSTPGTPPPGVSSSGFFGSSSQTQASSSSSLSFFGSSKGSTKGDKGRGGGDGAGGGGGGGGASMVASPTSTRHLDVVTEVAVSLVPYPCVISAGRDGVVKVWK
ncbi:Serine/threonine-protein kinase [Rhizophlyctis rosea]|nr:Serine/threonine-protein kinase [Rhizophlyctis rosea]